MQGLLAFDDISSERRILIADLKGVLVLVSIVPGFDRVNAVPNLDGD